MKYSQSTILDFSKSITLEVGEFLKKEFGSIKDIKIKRDFHFTIEEDLIANKMYEEYFIKNEQII